MSTKKFDGEGFFAALDAARLSRGLTWKKVAEQSGVPASTLTRMSQGRKPDVDSLSALSDWSQINPQKFMGALYAKSGTESLVEITAHLRADPNLSKEGVLALEAIIKTMYKQMSKK